MLGQILNVTSFHDGYLTSVAVGEKTARFGLRKTSGARFDLVLGGVEALCVEDFREGNIISDLTASTGGEPTVEETRVLSKLFFHDADPTSLLATQGRCSESWKSRLRRLKDGTAALIVLESSYGADTAAYCTAVELVETS